MQHFYHPVEYAQLFAALIARTAKDVDVLIDSLPSEESTAALQVRTFTSNSQTCIHSYRLFDKREQTLTKVQVVLLALSQQGELSEQLLSTLTAQDSKRENDISFAEGYKANDQIAVHFKADCSGYLL